MTGLLSKTRLLGLYVVTVLLAACQINTPPSTPTPLIATGPLSLPNGFPVYLYRVEYHLKRDLAGMGATITHEANHLRITLPDNASFNEKSQTINRNLNLFCVQIAKSLKRMDKTASIVHGYTDDQGMAPVNQALSERRAHTVLATLEAEGVSAYRLASHGHGENNPRADNKTAEGRLSNRRIEITVYAISHQRYQAIWIYPLNKEFAFYNELDTEFESENHPLTPILVGKTQDRIRKGCFWGLKSSHCNQESIEK